MGDEGFANDVKILDILLGFVQAYDQSKIFIIKRGENHDQQQVCFELDR